MIPKLREQYQVPFVNDIRAELVKNPQAHIACNLVGGGGKTFIFTWLALNCVQNGWKVFVFSDRVELITQASGAFSQFGLKHAFINPRARKPDYDADATICSSQTFRRRYEKPEWAELFKRPKTIVIIDEADRQEFNYLFISGLLDGVTVLGFSGTFARSGGMRQVGLDYDVIVKGVTPKKLVELGYLVQDRYFSVTAPDMADVPFDSRIGDYNPNAVYQKFNKKEIYEGMIDAYMTHTPNTKALAFGASQLHAIKIAVEFQKVGINAMYLISGITKPKKLSVWKNDGERMKYERDLESYMTSQQYLHLTGNRTEVLNSFKKSKIKMLTNAGLFGTGLDVPDLETVIIDKSTLSLREYLQISWRVVRISPETGKIFGNIIDMGNHAHRENNALGRCLDDHNFYLWHDVSKGSGIQPTKMCDSNKEDMNKKRGCGRLIAVMYQDCPFCGHHFMSKKEIKTAELKEIAYGDEIEEEVLISTMNYKQLFAYRKLKAHQMGWVGRVLFARGGKEALKLAMDKNPELTTEKQEVIYKDAGKIEVYKGFKSESYKHAYIRNRILKYIK
jgi:superfamily II DNA or RNA helicase